MVLGGKGQNLQVFVESFSGRIRRKIGITGDLFFRSVLNDLFFFFSFDKVLMQKQTKHFALSLGVCFVDNQWMQAMV